MPVFPPAMPVAVVVDGRPISAYYQAYERAGRVFAPVRPFLSAVADRVWFEGNRLAIARGGRTVYVTVASRAPDALDRVFVVLAPLARGLGANVDYRRGILEIATAPRALASPTPVPLTTVIAPRMVFTPTPAPTPRPVWSGPALPRRTPLPMAIPTTIRLR